MENNKEKVVIGGTFDLFHKGHKELVKKGFELGDVVIGLTSDRMARETKNRQVESFESRKKNIEEYADEEFGKKIEVREIEDKFGFAVQEELDFIVVSTETETNAALISEERKRVGKNPLKIVKIGLILAEDGKPISSTRIRNGEIDKEGKICS